MKRLGSKHPSPALVIALGALFFALGGSAFAIGQAVRPQARCQEGAVRGIALVTGQPTTGIANVPDAFTSDKSYFAYRWNCTGGPVAVRRVPSTEGVYEVRFGSGKSPVAVGATVGGPGGAVSVTPLGPGLFRVDVFGSKRGTGGPNEFAPRSDLQFSLVAF